MQSFQSGPIAALSPRCRSESRCQRRQRSQMAAAPVCFGMATSAQRARRCMLFCVTGSEHRFRGMMRASWHSVPNAVSSDAGLPAALPCACHAPGSRWLSPLQNLATLTMRVYLPAACAAPSGWRETPARLIHRAYCSVLSSTACAALVPLAAQPQRRKKRAPPASCGFRSVAQPDQSLHATAVLICCMLHLQACMAGARNSNGSSSARSSTSSNASRDRHSVGERVRTALLCQRSTSAADADGCAANPKCMAWAHNRNGNSSSSSTPHQCTHYDRDPGRKSTRSGAARQAHPRQPQRQRREP